LPGCGETRPALLVPQSQHHILNLILPHLNANSRPNHNRKFPMSVDSTTVRRVARLARLKVNEEDVPRLAGELNVILAFVEQLNEVDIKDVAPLTSVVSQAMKMRDDVVTDGGYARAVTQNAPASEDEFFMVPKVVE
jgi:aspartyl-tRNA(Asn)/glutamyl-tRNA(Gln) amidotransferase subunit C